MVEDVKIKEFDIQNVEPPIDRSFTGRAVLQLVLTIPRFVRREHYMTLN